MIGVSGCLIGKACTYSGQNHFTQKLKELYDQGIMIAVCPEVLGGLTIPRKPAEIQQVHPYLITTNDYQDVTEEYIRGAKKALQIFKEHDVDVAILKFRSPSCGTDGIYDGTFTHHLIDGQGVFAKLCQEEGIRIFNENQLTEFLKNIREDEKYGTYFKD